MFKAQKTHEEMISEQAISFIKKNKKLLIEKFANNEICLPSPKNENPVFFLWQALQEQGKQNFQRDS